MLPDLPARPPRGPPSTSSSTSEVDTTEPTDSTPRGPAIDVVFNIGGRHCQNRRQHPPGGPVIDVLFNLDGGHCRTRLQLPQGARHGRLLQPRWWTLLDPPVAPPRGPPSTSSSTSVVDVAGPTDSAPRGPTIDVFFNLGGGRYRTRRHRPQGP
jgi:hypothetical protein